MCNVIVSGPTLGLLEKRLQELIAASNRATGRSEDETWIPLSGEGLIFIDEPEVINEALLARLAASEFKATGRYSWFSSFPQL